MICVMERVLILTRVVHFTKVNGLMIRNRAREFLIGKMAPSMMALGVIIIEMAKAHSFILMEIAISAIGRMMFKTERVSTSLRMVIFMKGNICRVNGLAKAYLPMPTETGMLVTS